MEEDRVKDSEVLLGLTSRVSLSLSALYLESNRSDCHGFLPRELSLFVRAIHQGSRIGCRSGFLTRNKPLAISFWCCDLLLRICDQDLPSISVMRAAQQRRTYQRRLSLLYCRPYGINCCCPRTTVPQVIYTILDFEPYISSGYFIPGCGSIHDLQSSLLNLVLQYYKVQIY